MIGVSFEIRVIRKRLNGRVILTWSLRVHCSVQMSVMRLRACLAISSRNMLHKDRLRSPIWCLWQRGKKQNKCLIFKLQLTVLCHSHFKYSCPLLSSTPPPPTYTVFFNCLQGPARTQQFVPTEKRPHSHRTSAVSDFNLNLHQLGE